MAKGRKTGGRTKGTPNRRTAEAAALLNSLGCDPLEGMARIALDTGNPVALRGRMYAELAQYVYSKRRAEDVDADSGPNIQFVINTDPQPFQVTESEVDQIGLSR